MSTFTLDYQKLWKDGRFFAQLPVPTHASVSGKTCPSDGSLVGDVRAVVMDLLGDTYQLDNVEPQSQLEDGYEVYDVLTRMLPTLSMQSAFFWERAARTLGSMLSLAKYPIRSQASHLVFWWARLGGLMGATSLAKRKGGQSECTSDDSPLEFSWVIPRNTDPSAESNRRVRFTIDPFHPEIGHRLAGGATLDWLWSNEGSLGLVKKDDGSKDWKDILEKWLFPELKNTEEFVDGTTYMIAFDMEPSGEITLKQYYMPPHAPLPCSPPPTTSITTYRFADDMEPFRRLVKSLHPSLEEPFGVFCDYLNGDGKDSGMSYVMVACDIAKVEKNRLKLYFVSPRTTLKDMIYDMTLGGRLTGPRVDDAMKNFVKFFTRLFPYARSDDTELIRVHDLPAEDDQGRVGRSGVRMMYYFEFFVGEPTPYPKIYFFMDHFSKNDLDTAKSTEMFLRDVGKKGEDGWLSADLARVNRHRPLDKRNGLHTMVSFGTKPSGWEVTCYYSAEIYAAEREAKSACHC